MPYLLTETRKLLDDLTKCFETLELNPGRLNYIITKLCHAYIKRYGEKYDNYNDLIGALECAKLELYRRKVAPYEDVKIKENGDVL